MPQRLLLAAAWLLATGGVLGAQEQAVERKPNRLAKEQSPYLRDHAQDPVDWYPWGEEAFARARKEGKLIFLSIGYATCHWCHVMHEESFRNPAVARFLNEHYVAIKVDREERPDVDEVYMTAVQLATGSGGWPLSVWLTPDQRPLPDIPEFEQHFGSSLTGGTYFPQPSRFGRRPFLEELQVRAELWEKQRTALQKDAEYWSKELAGHLSRPTKPVGLDERTLERGYEGLSKDYDREHGGFGAGAKFPMPHTLGFLFRYYLRTGKREAADMAARTLDAIATGGLRDHLGGGFHRYATDRAWQVPHFEKMLYDQAGLARAFVEAHQLTGEPRYAQVARETLDFVLRAMRTPEGGFTSAWGADSEGVEGKYYLWSAAELEALLGADAPLFMARYAVTKDGNVAEMLPGQKLSHLRLQDSLQTLAKRHGLKEEQVTAKLEAARRTLLEARAKRPAPLHDDKVLADWSGLAIGACALGGRALGEPRYVEAARQGARFVLARMRKDGALLHRWRGGEAAIPGMLEDYAFLAGGLLDLYEATGEPRWLAEARALAEGLERFADPEEGGYFRVGKDSRLLARPKPIYDGAIPSGNGAAALVLLRLSSCTGEQALYERARRALASYSQVLVHHGGQAATLGLQAVDWFVGPRRELVIAGDPAAAGTQALLAEARQRLLARTVLIARPEGPALAELVKVAPWVEAQAPKDKRPTAYLCAGFACQAPVHEPAALRRLLLGKD
ncbi:MAG: thioredoxin domain-containing protein [Planctomycetota bacterium]